MFVYNISDFIHGHLDINFYLPLFFFFLNTIFFRIQIYIYIYIYINIVVLFKLIKNMYHIFKVGGLINYGLNDRGLAPNY